MAHRETSHRRGAPPAAHTSRRAPTRRSRPLSEKELAWLQAQIEHEPAPPESTPERLVEDQEPTGGGRPEASQESSHPEPEQPGDSFWKFG